MIRYIFLYIKGESLESIRITSRVMNDGEHINYISRCKKYVIFTDSNVYIYIINPVDIYKRLGENDIDKIELEKRIADLLATQLRLPHDYNRTRCVCFSDTHGDIFQLLFGIRIWERTGGICILNGDICNIRYDLWTGGRISDTDDAERNRRSIEIVNEYKKNKHFIALVGNHDMHAGNNNIRVVIANKKRQIVFQHYFIYMDEEEHIEELERFNYENDLVVVYKTSKNDPGFYHTVAAETTAQNSKTEMDRRVRGYIYKAIGKRFKFTYNPYMVVGHDHSAIFISSNIEESEYFPLTNIDNRTATISEVIDESRTDIYHRILSTDGLPIHAWRS